MAAPLPPEAAKFCYAGAKGRRQQDNTMDLLSLKYIPLSSAAVIASSLLLPSELAFYVKLFFMIHQIYAVWYTVFHLSN